MFTFTSGGYTAEFEGVLTSELALSLFGNTRIRAYGFLNIRDNKGNTGGGARLLHPWGQEPEVIPGPTAAQRAALPPYAQKWRSWWIYPFGVGVGVVILGGWLMYWALEYYGVGFWFLCSWLPFLDGVALLALAWSSRTSHWMHLRVRQAPGEWPRNFAISMPLPLGLASWFFRTFGDNIPGIEQISMEELIQSVDRNTSPDNPVYIEVEEGERGEQVQIYIG